MWNLFSPLLIRLSQTVTLASLKNPPNYSGARSRAAQNPSARLISLPWKIHINNSMARSLVFVSMTQHPAAAPAVRSFFKVDTKHSALLDRGLIVFRKQLAETGEAASMKEASSSLPIPPANCGWHRRAAHSTRSLFLRPQKRKIFKSLSFSFFLCVKPTPAVSV